MRTIPMLAILSALVGLPACLPAYQADSPGKASSEKDKAVVFAKPQGTETARITPRIYLAANRLLAGTTQRFAVVIDIDNGWHINTNVPRPSYVIPTSVKIAGRKKHVKIEKMAYPPGQTLPIPGAKVPLTVYEGRVIFFGDLKLPQKLAGQTKEITFALKYQLCNDRQCLAPKTVKLKGKASVVAANQAVQKVNSEIFKKDPRKDKKP